jgi:hypothetical protein
MRDKGKVFFSKALGPTYQYDRQFAIETADLNSFVQHAGPPGGNTQLGIPHTIPLRCRALPSGWPLWCPPQANAGWQLVLHTWSAAQKVLQDLPE